MHVIEVVFTGIVMCFVTATIIGLCRQHPDHRLLKCRASRRRLQALS